MSSKSEKLFAPSQCVCHGCRSKLCPKHGARQSSGGSSLVLIFRLANVGVSSIANTPIRFLPLSDSCEVVEKAGMSLPKCDSVPARLWQLRAALVPCFMPSRLALMSWWWQWFHGGLDCAPSVRFQGRDFTLLSTASLPLNVLAAALGPASQVECQELRKGLTLRVLLALRVWIFSSFVTDELTFQVTLMEEEVSIPVQGLSQGTLVPDSEIQHL